MVIFAIGTYAVNSIILGWVGATCGQTKEKRAVALSIIVSTSNASFIWTPVSLPFQTPPFFYLLSSQHSDFRHLIFIENSTSGQTIMAEDTPSLSQLALLSPP